MKQEQDRMPSLPGLDRLVAVCERHSLLLKLNPPLPSAPRLGESVLGEPLDDQLATVYQRFGGAELGPLSLYRPGLDWLDLIPWNEQLRQRDIVHFRSSLIFGEEAGFPIYLATVPKLADAQGLQPVIYIEAVDTLTCVPVASSVDRFFDTYSRYLELMVVDPEYLYDKNPDVIFPWSVQRLIARDEPLMEQVRAGRFDFLTQDDAEAHQWVQQLHTTRP
jgi:hypothetical protein